MNKNLNILQTEYTKLKKVDDTVIINKINTVIVNLDQEITNLQSITKETNQDLILSLQKSNKYLNNNIKVIFDYFSMLLKNSNDKLNLWLMNETKRNMLLNSDFETEFNSDQLMVKKKLDQIKNEYYNLHFPKLFALYMQNLIDKLNYFNSRKQKLLNQKSVDKNIFIQNEKNCYLIHKESNRKYKDYEKNFFQKTVLMHKITRQIKNFISKYDEKYKIAKIQLKKRNAGIELIIFVIGLFVLAIILLIVWA